MKRRLIILGISLLVLVVALGGLLSVLDALPKSGAAAQNQGGNTTPTTTPVTSNNGQAVSPPVNLTPDINPSKNFSISLPKIFNFDISKALNPNLDLNTAASPHLPLLKVTGAANTAYLKSINSSYYDGIIWQPENIAGFQPYNGETLSLPGLKNAQTVTDTITVDKVANVAPGNEALPTSLYPVSVDAPQSLLYSPQDMTFMSQGNFPDEYTFETTHFNFSTQTLAKAQTDPSAQYLQLPNNITPRTYNLAKSITGGITSPFLQAKAIEDYLKTNYTYDFNYKPAPSGAEANDWFLFTEKRGVCTNFNSAFVVLARAAGLPARMAGGFYVDPTAAEQTVYADQAHAWAEVKFKDLGWYTFDATGSPDGGQVTAPTPTVTSITSTDPVAAKGDTFNISGTVYTDTHQPADGAMVEILVNTTKTAQGATVVGQGIVSQGRYDIQAVIPGSMTVGNYQVIAHTVAGTQYAESFSDPQIKVVSDSAIKLNVPAKVKAGATVTVSGLLTGKYGEPLAFEHIGMTLDDAAIPSPMTDSAGRFSCKVSTDVPGEHTVTAYFAGTEFFRSANQETTFRVLAPAALNIQTSGETVNKPVTVSGQLKEQSTNQPLGARALTVSIDGKTTDISQTTDSSGKYSFKYTFSATGSHNIQVAFAGDEDYYGVSAAVSLDIKAAAVFHIWPIIIAVLALAAAGTGGWFLFKWLDKRPRKMPPPAENAAEAVEEPQPAQTSSGGLTLTIELPRIAPPFPDVWGVGEELQIAFRLEDENGGVAGQLLAAVNHQNVPGLTTDKNGRAAFNRVFPEKGQYNIAAEYGQFNDTRYAAASRPVRIVDYREEIVALFNSLVNGFRADGIAIKDEDTPRQIEAAVLKAGAGFPEKALAEAVGVFEEADYSLHPITRANYETMYLAQMEIKQHGQRTAAAARS